MTATTTAPESRGLDRGLLTVAAVVVLGAVMSILDTTVVNVAIPTLAKDFSTSLTTIQWVVTGYTLALATVIPITGWAADRFGTKRLYLLSIALFLAGSLLSGIAWSAESLIAFRILQGLGGGMLMPLGMTILTRAAGPGRVGRVMSIIGVPMLLAPIFGPILGGWLVDDVSWRWIFFINLPVAIAALTLAARVVPRDTPAPQHAFDSLGLVLVSPGLALLIYGLAESAGAGGVGSANVLVPALAGVVLLVLFVRHALRADEPLIDLRLFTNRTFAAASGMLVGSPSRCSARCCCCPDARDAGRGPAHRPHRHRPDRARRHDADPRRGAGPDPDQRGHVLLDDRRDPVRFGMGMGATMMPIMSGAMQTLKRAAVARASTTLNILQQVGASIGTAVLTVILTHELSNRLPAAGGEGIGAVPADARAQVAPLMADAFGATFWWALGLLAVAFAAAFLLPRSKPEAPADEELELPADAAPVLIHA